MFTFENRAVVDLGQVRQGERDGEGTPRANSVKAAFVFGFQSPKRKEALVSGGTFGGDNVTSCELVFRPSVVSSTKEVTFGIGTRQGIYNY
jgi:hypothetical protein